MRQHQITAGFSSFAAGHAFNCKRFDRAAGSRPSQMCGQNLALPVHRPWHSVVLWHSAALPDSAQPDNIRFTLFSGADTVEMNYFGAAHTDGDAFIVFRGLGAMHAGGTFPGLNVVARHGGSAEAYPQTMSRAASEISGVRTVIPGHGPLKTWQDFVDSAAALRRRNRRGALRRALIRSRCEATDRGGGLGRPSRAAVSRCSLRGLLCRSQLPPLVEKVTAQLRDHRLVELRKPRHPSIDHRAVEDFLERVEHAGGGSTQVR
jgi:glyoxylase-like metal-dependent hydrolase (beta-lactamase superfamily II)